MRGCQGDGTQARLSIEGLGRLKEWQVLEKSGYQLRLEPFPLSRRLISSLLLLLENNMRPHYERSSWGWNREMKRSELCDQNTVIISLLPSDAPASGSVPVGFMSFQFTQEPLGAEGASVPSIYCYELQLEAAHRGRGIGKMLIDLMEIIGIQNGAQASALSVFRFNTAAVHFYIDRCEYGKSADNAEDDDVLVLYKLLSLHK